MVDKTRPAIVAGVLGLALFASTLAADNLSPPAATPPIEQRPATLQGGTQARMLKPNYPAYPPSAANERREGWVELSFTVRADGTVADPVVEDSSGYPAFEKAALKAILNQRYEPATWNGRPVEQCAASLRVTFLQRGMGQGASRPFINTYKEIVAVTQQDRALEAEAKLDAMTREGVKNHYEAGRLWLLRSTVQARLGDKAGQLRSLERALGYSEARIEKELREGALMSLFALQVEFQQFGGALKTYDKFKKLKPSAATVEIDRAAEQLNEAIDNDKALSFAGPVEYRSGCAEGRPNWRHELVRREFGIDVLEGKAEDFELRCDWRRVVDKVDPTRTWKVPPSWGWCQIFVFGELGSKVRLVEYPLAAEQKGMRYKPLSFQ